MDIFYSLHDVLLLCALFKIRRIFPPLKAQLCDLSVKMDESESGKGAFSHQRGSFGKLWRGDIPGE